MRQREFLQRRRWTSLAITAWLLLLTGCNPNVSKEGRIRQLEAEVQRTTEQVEVLEDRVKALESQVRAQD